MVYADISLPEIVSNACRMRQSAVDYPQFQGGGAQAALPACSTHAAIRTQCLVLPFALRDSFYQQACFSCYQ